MVGEVLDASLPPDLRAVASLAVAEIATRGLAATEASAALVRARAALESAPNALLARELANREAELSAPVARIEEGGGGAARDADVHAIEEVTRGDVFVVDACRRIVIAGRARVPLATRPVLFALLVELARAAPAPVSRDGLAMRAFEVRKINESHRGRLRVEIGRLRKILEELGAEPVATADGYALVSKRPVAILSPRDADDASHVAILLGDGASWSAQRVAESAGISKRTAQRALAELVESGRAVRSGSGRNVRYARAGAPIASRMLLLGLAPDVADRDQETSS